MKLYKSIMIILTLMLVNSCEKFIDVDQPDVIENDQAFTDKNSTKLSVIAIYGLMSDLVEPLFLAGEVRADLAVANNSSESYFKEFSNNTFSASNPYISTKPYYTIINSVNDFIFEFEKLVADNQMDSADFVKYKSEMVALRVWNQYQLAKIYGKCKYYTHALNHTSQGAIQELPFGNELFQLLINDLSFSDTNNFTLVTSDIVWQVIRFSDFYVNNLMGEIYLDMGEYEKALEKFDEVLSRGDYDNRVPTVRFNLNEDLPVSFWHLALFDDVWLNDIFLNCAVNMIAFDNKYNQTNLLRSWTASLDYKIAPANWFIEQFEDQAFTFDDIYDGRIYSVRNSNNEISREHSINKYGSDDRPFFLTRTARVKAMFAYCTALEDNSKVKRALSSLSEIRERVGLPEFDDDEIPDDDIQALRWFEEILVDELAYENAFEGQRWFDLKRIAERRNDPSFLIDRVIKKYPEEAQEQMRIRLNNKANWYIPIFE